MTRRAEPRCGNAHPPADGTPEREIIDRFADFLRAAGPAVSPADVKAGRFHLRSPAHRYHLRFLAWRVGQVRQMDRYYRATCPHGYWAALLTGEAAQAEWVEIVCPQGCAVIMVTTEAAPDVE